MLESVRVQSGPIYTVQTVGNNAISDLRREMTWAIEDRKKLEKSRLKRLGTKEFAVSAKPERVSRIETEELVRSLKFTKRKSYKQEN